MENVELRRTSARKSKNKLKFASFTSYFRRSHMNGQLISEPTNFEKKEFQVENLAPHVSIQECPFDVTGYGKLIMRDKFKMKRPVKKESVTVFMFERIIVFTSEEETDLYYYLGSIQMTNLSMVAPKKKNKILLVDYNKMRQPNLKQMNVEYKLKTKNVDTAKAWREAIQKCLWKELLSARGQQCDVDCRCEVQSGKIHGCFFIKFHVLSICNYLLDTYNLPITDANGC
ncbi:unnamed protein product [Phyllotreta striolata]|uniref:SOS1/NGEF-like PH domain-containing protein n=1 Tax=Phyllotreta striolata TaxID=444603 RepID=A0A9P0DRP2_PHYSR|nr:unnamed protein product [Phyllotreta striolata]